MEKIFTAYTRKIEDTNFYFVKVFIAFPEWQNVAPVLGHFGMHSNFDQACKIARVDDEMKPLLLQQIENCHQQAKIISLNDTETHMQKSVGF